MSVTTISDEKRDSAKKNINNAIDILNLSLEDLKVATDINTWGSSEYNENYYCFLNDAQIEILQFVLKLKNISRKI